MRVTTFFWSKNPCRGSETHPDGLSNARRWNGRFRLARASGPTLMGRFAGIRFKSLRIEAPWVGFAPSPQVRERTNKPPSEGGLVLDRARLRATTETSLPERRLARRQSPTIAAPEIEANQQGDEAADQGNEKSRLHGAIGVARYVRTCVQALTCALRQGYNAETPPSNSLT